MCTRASRSADKADDGEEEEEEEETAQRLVGGVMLEEVEEEGRGEERGVKNKATFTRGAATPSGTFKGATLIVLDRAPIHNSRRFLL